MKNNVRKRKRKRKSNRKGLIFITILILFIIFIIVRNVRTIPASTTNQLSQNIPAKENEVIQNANRADIQDWKLIIVNKDNHIPEKYQVETDEIEQGFEVDKRIIQNLSNMLKDARKQGLKPWICSAYRSSEKQKKLFNNKLNYYKNQGYSEKDATEKASYWVAIPGTSEHEIGLSLDIVSKNYQILDKNQENTPEQKWLMENCTEYGFIVRYPTEKQSITKIEYEPWHYRYVGIENAKSMKEKNFCLEEYIDYLKNN